MQIDANQLMRTSKYLSLHLRHRPDRLGLQHVHLSPDVQTALRVGARHGTPVVFAVDAAFLMQVQPESGA